MLCFYSDGSLSLHEGRETLEEYRSECGPLHCWARLSEDGLEEFHLIDSQRTRIEVNEETTSFSRFFPWWHEERESINERLLVIEHTSPDRLIESLISSGDYGEALRVCKVFERRELSDDIHERQVRLSSSQLASHLTKIRSRLHVLQLASTLLYPTFEEQFSLIRFALDQATKKTFFLHLSHSDEGFFHSISEETLNTGHAPPPPPLRLFP